jgi:hypothetical protein
MATERGLAQTAAARAALRGRRVPPPEIETKACRKCGQRKLLTEFYRDVSRADQLDPRCRDCRTGQLGPPTSDAERQQRWLLLIEAKNRHIAALTFALEDIALALADGRPDDAQARIVALGVRLNKQVVRRRRKHDGEMQTTALDARPEVMSA